MNGPFKLVPAFQDYLWGGTRLAKEFHKTPDKARFPEGTPIAESWECSTHADGESMCVTGTTVTDGTVPQSPWETGDRWDSPPVTSPAPVPHDSSVPLSQYLRAHPEALGTHPNALPGELPVLIKLLDAAQPPSVQVHPDDDYARVHENGSRGKTEMWYVIDALPGAKLVYGLTRTLSRDELTEIVRQGKIERYLQEVPVRKGDVFYIPAGTVHALGKGMVVYEVQECSNITYRLYDYHRKDKNGRERELHIDKALDVMNLKGTPPPRQKLRSLRYRQGYASEILSRCQYFQVERLLINTAGLKDGAPFATDDTSFCVLTCTEGEGSLTAPDTAIPFVRGDSIFVPANCTGLTLTGKAELLLTRC